MAHWLRNCSSTRLKVSCSICMKLYNYLLIQYQKIWCSLLVPVIPSFNPKIYPQTLELFWSYWYDALQPYSRNNYDLQSMTAAKLECMGGGGCPLKMINSRQSQWLSIIHIHPMKHTLQISELLNISCEQTILRDTDVSHLTRLTYSSLIYQKWHYLPSWSKR